MSNKKRIALYYHAFLGGGAEAVGLWMLDALQHDYDVTLFTVAEVDLERLNQLYGTNLSPKRIQVRAIFPKFMSGLVNFLIANNDLLHLMALHGVLRSLKQEAGQYDLCMSAYNGVDFGRVGIQYMHWVKVVEGGLKKYPWCLKISDFSIDRMKQNIAIANSKFTAQKIEETYGISAEVIYPPVLLEVDDIPWSEKENAFVCSGRIVDPKQPHKAIQIVKAVRERGFDVKLYLTGGGGGVYATRYQRFVKQMVRRNSEWVTLYENLSYDEYVEVLRRCRYGIHIKLEPFGISIAEMLKAGAIPFVKNRGGQYEIIGEEHPELFFSDPKTDAIEKIVRVLSDESLQLRLRDSLDRRKNLFSKERFSSEIQQRVRQYFEDKHN
ncbi:glycosyltransferase [Baaleninema sp.]|uniref:glycosyltransferase n=1 Tax=Baaleninema sp. TaxID=3101197 RepID=UPI003CFCA8D9